MTTVDELDGGLVVNTKGAPEEVLARCTTVRRGGRELPITDGDRAEASAIMTGYAQRGLRVLAFAYRSLPRRCRRSPRSREDAERDLCLAGLAAMLDPPRPEVAAAIERAHHAGIRIHVVTGDNGLTAAAIARSVGIGAGGMQVVTGTELDAMTEARARRRCSAPGRKWSSPAARPRPSCGSPTRCARWARSSR